MKNIQFSTVEEADLFVDSHAHSIGNLAKKFKAINVLMHGACLYGIHECLDPNSPHYVASPFSRQFTNEMKLMGVEVFIDKMMNAERHYWSKRQKLQEFVSKRIQCATTKVRTIEAGQAIIIYEPLTYFDRTVYDVNSLAYKQLESQKPLLIDWLVNACKSNPTFNLGTSRKEDDAEYYDMIEISIDDAINILNNDYIVPHVSIKTNYMVPSSAMWTSKGEEVNSWSYGKVTDDWDHYSTSLEISFSSIQAENSSESHLYGDSVYLWNGSQPCIN